MLKTLAFFHKIPAEGKSAFEVPLDILPGKLLEPRRRKLCHGFGTSAEKNTWWLPGIIPVQWDLGSETTDIWGHQETRNSRM